MITARRRWAAPAVSSRPVSLATLAIAVPDRVIQRAGLHGREARSSAAPAGLGSRDELRRSAAERRKARADSRHDAIVVAPRCRRSLHSAGEQGETAAIRSCAHDCRRRGSASPSLAPARDHVGFVEEPERAVLLQHLARGFEIAAVGGGLRDPVVLDLRHIDRGVPGREQRRGADRGFLR